MVPQSTPAITKNLLFHILSCYLSSLFVFRLLQPGQSSSPCPNFLFSFIYLNSYSQASHRTLVVLSLTHLHKKMGPIKSSSSCLASSTPLHIETDVAKQVLSSSCLFLLYTFTHVNICSYQAIASLSHIPSPLDMFRQLYPDVMITDSVYWAVTCSTTLTVQSVQSTSGTILKQKEIKIYSR